MPGVIDSNLDSGVSREVGKMAFFMHPDLLQLAPDDISDLEEMANKFLHPSYSPRDNGDSEGELLPDEPTVDLLKYLDPETDPHEFDSTHLPRSLLCDADCTQCCSKKTSTKDRVSAKDPFMGSTMNLNRSSVDSSCSTPSWSILGQIINPLEDHNHTNPQQDTFSAWSHTSNSDEYQVFTKTSFSLYQEEDADDTFPDTPSTYSEHAVTDDSDVDIETVTDAPRSADLYASSSQSSSPLSSPCLSPTPTQNLQKGSLMTILSRSSASSGANSPTSPSSKTILRFNAQGVSSSVSLAENLMAGRSHSISGQKRKLQKEKKLASKVSSSSSSSSSSSASHQAAYSHILVNSNSVNFHDYALSPGSCVSSTETGRPTVMTKRMYRKRQFASMDLSEKEKQHHHNQLERNRRQKLADLFTDLRDEIPKIKSHSKASKVVILNDATDYIRELKRLEVHQESEKESLLQKQMLLKEQLRRLQSHSLLS